MHIFGENVASIGVQTDGGAMFIAGMTSVQELPINDLWTIQAKRIYWQAEDREHFAHIDPIKYYFTLQIEDFLKAIQHDQSPMVSAIEGRRVVELFAAIYRSRSKGLYWIPTELIYGWPITYLTCGLSPKSQAVY